MRLTSGLREADALKISQAVQQHGPFPTLLSLWRKSGVRVEALRQLAAADAFTSMGLDRQQALWATQQLRDDLLPMFEGMEVEEQTAALPEIALQTRVVYDYAATGLSLKAHPVSFAREMLNRRGVIPCGNLADEKRFPHGKRVSVAGLVLVRQRPGTASGILFMTMEDESGVANLVVRPDIYDQYRAVLRHSVGLIVHGNVERQGQVIHVFVHKAERLTRAEEIGAVSRDFH
jgi:error-prone DNA polymerase